MNDSYQQGATFGAGLASESHWLHLILVLTVHWWPALVCVGGLEVYLLLPWTIGERELEDGVGYVNLRATSNTRLRARDHCTSRTLIGGKGGAGPSLLHTTLEGPTEYVNAKWM